MGHYELLGVEPEASVAEIRRRYLALARESHPDFHTANPRAAKRAELEMRDLNEAWAVLSDPESRSAYDRARLVADPPGRPARPFHASTIAHEAFRPFDNSPDPGFDEAHDRPITDSRLPRWLALAPPLVVLGGVAGLVVGSIVKLTFIVDIALVMMLTGGVLFLVAPLFAVAMSRRGDTAP